MPHSHPSPSAFVFCFSSPKLPEGGAGKKTCIPQECMRCVELCPEHCPRSFLARVSQGVALTLSLLRFWVSCVGIGKDRGGVMESTEGDRVICLHSSPLSPVWVLASFISLFLMAQPQLLWGSFPGTGPLAVTGPFCSLPLGSYRTSCLKIAQGDREVGSYK